MEDLNKDLILREHLAVERTNLANERTLLAYVRTGLYFLIAGSTLEHLVASPLWSVIGDPLIVVGLVIVAIGGLRFFQVRKKVQSSRKNIGQASTDFIRDIRKTSHLK